MPDVESAAPTTAPDPAYTHGHHPSVLRSHTWRTAQNSAAYLLPHLRPGQHVLDVGCGPGTITVDLARLVAPGGRVTGLENVADPLIAARENAQRAGVDVRFVLGDVMALDLPDDSVDVVHAHQVLQHLTDPVGALREMLRVCRPGGFVAARDADYAAMTWYPDSDGLTRWQELYRQVARSNGAEPDAGRRLKEWALAAGVPAERIVTSGSVWCYASDAEVAWWSDLWADRVRHSGMATQALERGLARDDELQRLAAAWRDWGAEPAAWFLVPHGEILLRA